MTIEEWLIFVTVWFAAGLPLGPNAANCMAVSADQGFGRALCAVTGILAAGAIYMAVVALGLGALLLANEAIFSMLKLAGAAYLIWLGIRLIRSGGADVKRRTAPVAGRLATARRAFLISLSNPKAMISYGAVFSQFVDPGRALLPQLTVIAPTALAVVAIIYTGYSGLGVGIGRLLGSVRRRLWFNRGIGGFYVFAGTGLAASEAFRMTVRR